MATWGSWNKPSKTSAVTIQSAKERKGIHDKGRSSRTNHNKLRELKSFYKGVFKRSQKSKQSNPKKTKFFCDRFPTLESFLKYYPIKKIITER